MREAELSVSPLADGCEEKFLLPEDMWFILVLADGENAATLPKYLLDMACVINVALQTGKKAKTRLQVKKKETEEENYNEALETQEGDNGVEVVETVVEAEKTQVKPLVYSQFKKLVHYACRDYQLDEILWKRVDKLEEFVSGCGEYTVENKQWQRMEKFVSVYLAMGGEAEEALDSVVAGHLIYGLASCVQNSKKPLEEKFTHTLENIFGEGHAPASVHAAREVGLGL